MTLIHEIRRDSDGRLTHSVSTCMNTIAGRHCHTGSSNKSFGPDAESWERDQIVIDIVIPWHCPRRCHCHSHLLFANWNPIIPWYYYSQMVKAGWHPTSNTTSSLAYHNFLFILQILVVFSGIIYPSIFTNSLKTNTLIWTLF